MSVLKRSILYLCLCLTGIFPTTVRADSLSATDIMRRMDELQDLEQDITVKMKLTQRKVNEGTKVLESFYYRRDRTDQFLIVMLAPEIDRGNGYLREGDNMWMYRRNTRTFQILKRNDTIGGTDAKAGDMEKKKFTDLYEPIVDAQGREKLSEETLGSAQIPVYRLEVQAKVRDVTYPKEIHWVRKDNFLTMKKESYALSGTLMETAFFPRYTRIDDRYFPLQMIFVDEFEKGNRTLIELSGISLAPIPDHVFTKAYLENLSK
jgi:outer membrane lipoprotein-sorting protein